MLPVLLLAGVLSGCAGSECEPGEHLLEGRCVPDEVSSGDDGEPGPEQKDPCAPNPCTQPLRGQCSAVSGVAVCACDPGTREVEGGRCVALDACDPNPCTTPHKTVCSATGGSAVCACDPGYVPEGDGCQPEAPPITCAGQHATGDVFEPDECPLLAHAIDATGAQNEFHTLGPAADDVDWLRHTVTAGHIYEVAIGASPGVKVDVKALAADGTTVLASGSTGDEAVLRRSFKVAASEDVFFRVRAHEGQAGGYTFSLRDRGEDDHGDEPARASAVTVGTDTTVNGELQFDEDRDVLRFTSAGGRSYRFSALRLSTSPGPGTLRLELLAPDGTTVLASGEGTQPGFLTRLVAAGDYFLRVRGASGSPPASYLFQLGDLGADDHGDSRAEATPITSQGLTSGRFERLGDWDVLSFPAQAGHIQTFSCWGEGIGCYLLLMDETGQELARADGSGNNAIQYVFTRAGTYFIRLAGNLPGRYTWNLVDYGVDDYGGTPATASPLDTYRNGRIAHPGDADVFSYATEASHAYVAKCLSLTGGGFLVQAALLDADGNVLGRGVLGSSSSFSYKAGNSRTDYLQVIGDGVHFGEYYCSLDDKGPDDHGDTVETATAVKPQTGSGYSHVSSNFEFSGDVDVLSFETLEGHAYEVACMSCDFTVSNASGTEVRPLPVRYASGLLHVDFEVARGETYFVTMTSPSADARDYSWRVRDLGVDDHGDTPETATPLTLPSALVDASLETSFDVDVFSFPARAGLRYTFWCNPASIDCDLEVLNGAGTVLAAGTTGSLGFVEYEPSVTETLFVRVERGGDPLSGSIYTLRFQEYGNDDHGDTHAAATHLEPSEALATARMDLRGDRDVFAFEAQAGHVYEFTCSNPEAECYVSLENAAGTRLGWDNEDSLPAHVSYAVKTAGTYYAIVTHMTDVLPSTYEYRLRDLGPVP